MMRFLLALMLVPPVVAQTADAPAPNAADAYRKAAQLYRDAPDEDAGFLGDMRSKGFALRQAHHRHLRDNTACLAAIDMALPLPVCRFGSPDKDPIPALGGFTRQFMEMVTLVALDGMAAADKTGRKRGIHRLLRMAEHMAMQHSSTGWAMTFVMEEFAVTLLDRMPTNTNARLRDRIGHYLAGRGGLDHLARHARDEAAALLAPALHKHFAKPDSDPLWRELDTARERLLGELFFGWQQPDPKTPALTRYSNLTRKWQAAIPNHDLLKKSPPDQNLAGFAEEITKFMLLLVLPQMETLTARHQKMEAALRRFAPAKKTAKVGKPNFVLIFADDLGYADLGCYGNEIIKTPNIDRMARQGMRFTDFYAQTVCGPSRAALMTGCYPLRVAKSRNRVDVHPRLHTDEITIAEILKEQGYKTGCFGKWDLAGHLQKGYDRTLLPTEQGFDYFFGTPTSNDRLVHLLENDKVIERSANMATLTSRYTRKAMDFIETHKDEPFFVYIPHTMPHTKLAASKKFNGKSPRGLYGDVIEEIDFNVGRILKKIETLGLDDKTYVIFTSDNGPWWIKKEHGGKADPLRGAKTSIWEGGVRVPFIIRAPKNVPAGTVCTEVASTMDMLPTMARLGGGAAPSDRVIDGHDIGALIHGEKGAESPTKALFHYAHTHLQAVRSGKWKLHLTRPANPAWTPNWARHIDPEDVFEITSPLLYDLDADIGETTDVAAAHPGVVTRLLELAQAARNSIGDHDHIGAQARFFDEDPRRPDIGK